MSLFSRRLFTTTTRLRTASIPYTPSCPSPTCTCTCIPSPSNLDIDRKTPLLNTMASYSEHVVLCTGKDDWTSRIEDEQSPSGDFVRRLKAHIGKGGAGFDPFNNVMITASSFPASTTADTSSVLLFPSFRRIPSIPHAPTAISDFATAYLKARTLHPFHSNLSAAQKANLTRDESRDVSLPTSIDIDTATILICGHRGRDVRCGILGPLLREQFQSELKRRGIVGEVHVISHIGGHKYAGNVIIYLPPSARGHRLAGTGIWYGRVDTTKVEGIVEETIVGGRIIYELFRGGISQGGENLGRALETQIVKEKGEDGALRLKPRARA